MVILAFEKINAFNIIRICSSDPDVIINWYLPTDTCNNFIRYNIYARKNDNNSFEKIDSIYKENLNFYVHKDALTVSDEWSYVVEYEYNCGGTLVKNTDTFKIDKEKPEKIAIDSVSVNDGYSVIGWEESTENDVMGYIIYYVDNGMNVIIDTIYGKLNTSYIDSFDRDPTSKSILYKVVAMDSCLNPSLFSDQHKTIFLSGSQSYCDGSVSLNWNKYIAWNESNVQYEILVKESTETTYKVNKILTGNDISGVLSNLVNNTQYDIVVRARNLNSNYTSSSNVFSITTNFIEIPGNLYLRNVTVVKGDREVEIKWEIDKPGDVIEFVLNRGITNNLNEYDRVAYNGNTEYEYLDKNVYTDEAKYFYQIEMVDGCGRSIMSSDVSNTILLILEDVYDEKTLSWNLYKEWNGGIKLQRVFEEENDVLLSSLDKSAVVYSEGIQSEKIKGYEKCYYIEAEEQLNDYGYNENSRSNSVCITGEKIVYIPTAYKINSDIEENKYFKPVGVLIDYENSEMIIYDRWGEEVFRENGIKTGWNGSIKGNSERKETGVYMYFMMIQGKNGNVDKYSGSVTVIR